MGGKIKIALDVDDLLAGFYPAICERAGKEEIVTDHWDANGYCKFIVEEFPNIADDEDFWKTLPVLTRPNAITFDFDYYMSSMPPGMEDARRWWLRYNGFPDKPLIITSDKINKCKELGVKVLIDDKRSTISECLKNGIFGILFRPNYTKIVPTEAHVITHISQAKSLILNHFKNA